MAEKSENDGVKWGYILEAPRRPPLKRQRECIALHGVDLGEFGPVWHDKFTGRTTRYRKRLEAREDLLKAVKRGDTLVVAGVECLGGSEDDVDWFLGELSERGVSLIVNGGSVMLAPGEDRSGIVDRARRFQKAHHQARYRAKRS